MHDPQTRFLSLPLAAVAVATLALAATAWFAVDPGQVAARSSSGRVLQAQEHPVPPDLAGSLAYTREEDNVWNVYLADPNGTNERRVTSFEEGFWQEHVRWSPDGQQLAFDLFPGNATYEVFVMPRSGGIPEVIDLDRSATDPAWRPGGSGELAVALRERVADLSPHDVVLWRQGVITPLLAASGVDERGPDWAPDGDRLLFERRANDEATWDLWLADSDGSNPAPEVDSPELHERLARFSPDGRRIAYIGGHVAQGLGSLYVHDLESGVSEAFVDLADGPITWSPDGRRITFHSPRYSGPEVRLGAGSTNPAGDPRARGSLGSRSDGQQAEEALMGLYMIDLEDRTLYRLAGPAGGHPDNTLLGGYAPDWYAPSPTPTSTPSPTPTTTPSPTPTATARVGSGTTVYLPVALNGDSGAEPN